MSTMKRLIIHVYFLRDNTCFTTCFIKSFENLQKTVFVFTHLCLRRQYDPLPNIFHHIILRRQIGISHCKRVEYTYHYTFNAMRLCEKRNRTLKDDRRYGVVTRQEVLQKIFISIFSFIVLEIFRQYNYKLTSFICRSLKMTQELTTFFLQLYYHLVEL